MNDSVPPRDTGKADFKYLYILPNKKLIRKFVIHHVSFFLIPAILILKIINEVFHLVI